MLSPTLDAKFHCTWLRKRRVCRRHILWPRSRDSARRSRSPSMVLFLLSGSSGAQFCRGSPCFGRFGPGPGRPPLGRPGPVSFAASLRHLESKILGPLELCPALGPYWKRSPHVSLHPLLRSALLFPFRQAFKAAFDSACMWSWFTLRFLVGQPGVDPRADPLRSLRPRDQHLPTSFCAPLPWTSARCIRSLRDPPLSHQGCAN